MQKEKGLIRHNGMWLTEEQIKQLPENRSKLENSRRLGKTREDCIKLYGEAIDPKSLEIEPTSLDWSHPYNKEDALVFVKDGVQIKVLFFGARSYLMEYKAKTFNRISDLGAPSDNKFLELHADSWKTEDSSFTKEFNPTTLKTDVIGTEKGLSVDGVLGFEKIWSSAQLYQILIVYHKKAAEQAEALERMRQDERRRQDLKKLGDDIKKGF